LQEARAEDILDIIIRTFKEDRDADVVHLQAPMLICVDGPDSKLDQVLHGLMQFQSRRSSHMGLKVIVYSRQEQEISGTLNVSRISLSTVDESETLINIRQFMWLALRDREFPGGILTVREIDKLGFKSEGIFLWARYAIDTLSQSQGYLSERLRQLLDTDISESLQVFYHKFLVEQFSTRPDSQTRKRLFRVLGTLSVAVTHLTRSQLMGLVLVTDEKMGTWFLGEQIVSKILRHLQAVLVSAPLNPDNPGQDVLRFPHPSFPEFLSGSRNEFYTLSSKEAHTQMGLQCLAVLTRDHEHSTGRLRANPQDDDSSLSISQRICEDYVTAAAQYANEHWSTHVAHMDLTPSIKSQVDSLIQKKIDLLVDDMGILGLNRVGGLTQSQSFYPFNGFEFPESLR